MVEHPVCCKLQANICVYGLCANQHTSGGHFVTYFWQWQIGYYRCTLKLQLCIIMKTYARKSYVATGTATREYTVRNASSKGPSWKNGVTKCEPVEGHFSGWLSRFHETNGERILIY